MAPILAMPPFAGNLRRMMFEFTQLSTSELCIVVPAAVLLALVGTFPATAEICVGTCGSFGANGVVTQEAKAALRRIPGP